MGIKNMVNGFLQTTIRYGGSKYLLVNIWMLASMIYYGHTYFENSAITKYAQFFIDIIGVYAMFQCMQILNTFDKYTRKLIVALFWFITLVTIYVIISPSVHVSTVSSEFHGNIQATILYKVEMVCLISFFPAVYFAKRNLLHDNHMKVLFIIAWLLSVLSYFSFMRYLQELNDAKIVINNISYIVLSASALIFFAPKPMAYMYISATLILILLSAKRSALIGFTIMAIIYVYFAFKDSSDKRLLYRIFPILLIGGGLYFILANNNDAVFAMWNRWEADGTTLSERDKIWYGIMNRYFDGNIFSLIWGLGYNASLATVGAFAHNDWIEILSSMGVVGFFIYSLIYLIPIARLRRIKFDTIYKKTIVICLAQLFIHSLSSRAIFFSEYAIFFIAIGYSMEKLSKS